MNGRVGEDSGQRKSGTAHSAAEIKDVFYVIVDGCTLKDALQGFESRSNNNYAGKETFLEIRLVPRTKSIRDELLNVTVLLKKHRSTGGKVVADIRERTADRTNEIKRRSHFKNGTFCGTGYCIHVLFCGVVKVRVQHAP